MVIELHLGVFGVPDARIARRREQRRVRAGHSEQHADVSPGRSTIRAPVRRVIAWSSNARSAASTTQPASGSGRLTVGRPSARTNQSDSRVDRVPICTSTGARGIVTAIREPVGGASTTTGPPVADKVEVERADLRSVHDSIQEPATACDHVVPDDKVGDGIAKQVGVSAHDPSVRVEGRRVPHRHAALTRSTDAEALEPGQDLLREEVELVHEVEEA